MLVSSCLHWLSKALHAGLVSLFAQPRLHSQEIEPLVRSLFSSSILDMHLARGYTQKQRQYLDSFMQAILQIPEGIRGTFDRLAHALEQLGRQELSELKALLGELQNTPLFDEQ